LHCEKESKIQAKEITYKHPSRQSLLLLFNWLFEAALELDRMVVNTPETFREVAMRANGEALF
jgi:hypothetical protein